MCLRQEEFQASGFPIMCLLLVFANTMLNGCMSLPTETDEAMTQAQAPSSNETAADQPGNASYSSQSDYPARGSRTEAALTEGSSLVVKTVLLDPVLRPGSTVKALLGLTIKSAGGVFERTFINQMRFPKLREHPIPNVGNAPPMDLNAWERELDELSSTRQVRGSIEYLIDGDEYFPRLISVIDSAEQRIDIRIYIFDNDDVAVNIADHLRDRADQVEVRILVDGLGDLVAGNVDSSTLADDFTTPPSIEEYLEYGSMVTLRNQSNPWFTGDHAKITLIDQKTAFVGGMNIGREYRYDWHDMMMEINGPMVDYLQFEFDKAWERSGWLGDGAWIVRALAGTEALNDNREHYYPMRMLVTNIHDSQIYRAQVEAIRRSQNYIFIENAYFTDDKILFELARARRRGVDVRVIVSSSVDNNIHNLSDKPTINRMLENGIRVYAYPGMTHVKAAVFDGWACLGSANFDKLSLQINQEVNIATSHPQAVQRLLEQLFLRDFTISTEIKNKYQLNVVHHLAEFLADEML